LNGTGNALNNSITGNAGANFLDGGDGNDIINGGLGVDTMIGGFGNDIYIVDNINDLVTEATNRGIDWIYASINYTLSNEVENLLLTGTAGLNGTGNALNNSITGNAGANILNGGAGNDTINGGLGADTMIGGLGNDTYIVDNINVVVAEGIDEGTDWVYASIDYTLSSEVENLALTGTAHLSGAGNAINNSITGNAGANILNGGAGNDTISGGAGADTLIGGIGRDIITGGAGNDVFRFAAGDALISGTTSLSFDRITDFAIGIDSLDGVNAVSAFNLTKLGTVGTSLTSTKIESLLTTTAFTANGAAAFSFGSGTGLRTFVALNDAVAGFQAGTDGIVEITGYTGLLANLQIM
jgi:Ca2+-binding RTX toxin-like protein